MNDLFVALCMTDCITKLSFRVVGHTVKTHDLSQVALSGFFLT